MSWWDGWIFLTLRFWPFIFRLLSFLNALSYRCEIGLEWQIISSSFCIWEKSPLKSYHIQHFSSFLGKNNLCYSFSKNFAKFFKVFAYNLKLYDKSWQFLTSGSYNLSLTWNQASVAQSTLNFICFLSQK